MARESVNPSARDRRTVHFGSHSHLLSTHRPCPEHTLLKFCTARRCGEDRCTGRFVLSNRVGHPHNDPLHPGLQMHTPFLQRPWSLQLRGQVSGRRRAGRAVGTACLTSCGGTGNIESSSFTPGFTTSGSTGVILVILTFV